MKPPPGIRLENGRREGDEVVYDLKIAHWRRAWEVVKVLGRMRLHIHIEVRL